MTKRTKIAAGKIECNDDVLTEILLCLPPKSVFRFTCVSKTWKNIILNPFFLHCYSRRHKGRGGRLLGFLQHDRMNLIHNVLNIKDVPRVIGRFINYSNGLVLLKQSPCIYYVFNPVTKKMFMLPKHHCEGEIITRLMCEDNTSEFVPNYIVVRADVTYSAEKTMSIVSYSSKTGTWDKSTLLGTENFCLWRPSGVVLNGAFHWYSTCGKVVVYDPKDGDNHVQLIEEPCQTRDNYLYSKQLTRSTDNTLWYGMINLFKMCCWKLPKGENGSYKRPTTIAREDWVLMHSISFDSLVKDFYSTILSAENKRKPSSTFKHIYLKAFLPWNPLVAVVTLGKRIFLYNIESKSIELVRDTDGTTTNWPHLDFRYELGLFPYMESLSLSSYCL